MRTISLVNRFKWTFSGNMNPHALVLGDVDNDGDNEFVIGNLNGELAIFKGECPKGLPAYVCRGLGTITCIAVGDVRNWGRNSIVAINAEGHAHIFDLPRQPTAENAMSPEDYLKHGRRASDASSLRAFRRTMSTPQHPTADDGFHNKNTSDSRHTIQNLYKPNSTLKVPVNVNKLLIADFDGDGLNEIILARTDRILHAFQLSRTDSYFEAVPSMHSSSTSSPAIISSQQSNSPLLTPSGKLLGKRSSAVETKDKSFGLRKSMGWIKEPSPSSKKEQMDPKGGFIPDDNVQLVDKAVWVFDGQITSLSIAKHPEKPNEPILLVAQPGNTFTIIDSDGRRYNSDFTVQNSPQTQYGKIAKRPTVHEPQAASSGEPTPPSKSEADDDGELSATPKASDGPLFNLKKATQSIRTFLQRGSSNKSSPISGEMDAENVIISDEGKIHDTQGNEISRANYVVQNWPEIDGDDIIGEEESRAVATEIVIGKKLPALMDSTLDIDDEDDGPHVGMLSMDGKFTIYNLRTRQSFQRDLFVTHKLFSLATLDISSAFYAQSRAASPLPQSQAIPRSPNESPKLRFPVAPAESNSSNNGNPSGAGSPSFSSSSRLSRVTTNASGQSRTQHSPLQQDISVDENAESTPTPTRDHLRQTGLLDVTDPLAKSLLEAGTELTEDDITERISRADSIASSFDSKDEENVSWADTDEADQEGPPTAELFVACAWNGVTYLIDWSQRIDHSQIKFQLVQFAFEGRVCAFTAGLYAVSPGVNVPCLFYVDFEDQVFCYYDVRVSAGPVTGFIDMINDDVKEALERISSIDGEIRVLARRDSNGEPLDSDVEEAMDLGDGWRGVADSGLDATDTSSLGAQPTDLASFIHECLYNFEDMKNQLRAQVNKLENQRSKYRLPLAANIRRFSDLNISVTSEEEEKHHIHSASDEEESSTWMSDTAPSSPRNEDL